MQCRDPRGFSKIKGDELGKPNGQPVTWLLNEAVNECNEWYEWSLCCAAPSGAATAHEASRRAPFLGQDESYIGRY